MPKGKFHLAITFDRCSVKTPASSANKSLANSMLLFQVGRGSVTNWRNTLCSSSELCICESCQTDAFQTGRRKITELHEAHKFQNLTHCTCLQLHRSIPEISLGKVGW